MNDPNRLLGNFRETLNELLHDDPWIDSYLNPIAEALADRELLLTERDALRGSLLALLAWCNRFLIDEKHLIGSICRQADDAQFRHAIKQARALCGKGEK